MSDSTPASEPHSASAPALSRRWRPRILWWLSTVSAFVAGGWQLLPEQAQLDVWKVLWPRGGIDGGDVQPAATMLPEPSAPARASSRPLLEDARHASARCDFTTARKHFLLARESAARGLDSQAEASALVGLAELELRSRLVPLEAFGLLERVSQLEGVDAETRSSALVSLGDAHDRRREYDRAKTKYEQVLRDSASSSLLKARARLGIASIAIMQAEPERAREQLEASEQALDAFADRQRLADVYALRGLLFRKQAQPDRALGEYRRALALYAGDPCGNPREISALCAIGDLERDGSGGDALAREQYEQALRRATELGFASGRAQSLLGLAIVDSNAARFERSRGQLEEARRIYAEEDDLAQQTRVHGIWADLCRRQRDAACERDHSDRYARILAQLPAEARSRSSEY